MMQKLLAVGVIAVTSLIAVGGGWYMGGMLAPKTEAAVVATDDEEAEETELETLAAANVIELEPITTNLAYPAENWVRLEVAVLFTDQADVDMAGMVHQDILAYLRTVSLQQIEGARGFQHLREDLVERAVLRSDGKVSNLMFRTFVIE